MLNGPFSPWPDYQEDEKQAVLEVLSFQSGETIGQAKKAGILKKFSPVIPTAITR